MIYDDKKQTSLAAISKIIRRYLTFYRDDYIKDYIKQHKVTIETKELVEKESDLIINAMMKEVWDLNKEDIISKLENENKQNLIIERENLKKAHEKNEKIQEFKDIMSLIGDGIVIAFLMGIGVNQCTEIISKIKDAIFKSANIPVWLTTFMIIFLIMIIIIGIILKRFMERFGDVIKIIFNKTKEKD